VTPKQAEILSVVSEIGKVSLALRSLPLRDREDQLAMDEEDHAGQTYTYDSDATGLIRPPNSASLTQVVVVRGADVKAYTYARANSANGVMGQRPPHETNDEDH
jgi:Flp pilus assembly protein CpaB